VRTSDPARCQISNPDQESAIAAWISPAGGLGGAGADCGEATVRQFRERPSTEVSVKRGRLAGMVGDVAPDVGP
jgi:hypothetical protein